MTILIAGSSSYNREYMRRIQLLLAEFTDVHGHPPAILIDSEAQEVVSMGYNCRKLVKRSMLEVTAEARYSDYGTGDHHYNLTTPTVSFDRLQQRRKALAKQHFVKPLKKAKKREKCFVNVTWR